MERRGSKIVILPPASVLFPKQAPRMLVAKHTVPGQEPEKKTKMLDLEEASKQTAGLLPDGEAVAGKPFPT